MLQHNHWLDTLQRIHNQPNSIILHAPGRINLIGEHTDYNLGFCLPAAIDLGIYMGMTDAQQIEIHSLDQQNYWTEIATHQPNWLAYFRGVLKYASQNNLSIKSFRLDFGGALPSGAGLSSSSAICCGFLSLLNRFNHWNLDIMQMTKIAVSAERESGVEGGMMDQIAIFNGMANHALFIDCNSWHFDPIPILIVGFTWLIVDTNVKHNLLQSDYNNRSRACAMITHKIKEKIPTCSNIRIAYEQYRSSNFDFLNAEEQTLLSYVFDENDRVKSMVHAIRNSDISTIRQILFDGHRGLRDQYKVSCPELDFIVDFGLNNPSCIGSRMMGGGFGGSCINLIPNESVETFSEGLKTAYLDRFGFNASIYPARISSGIRFF